LREQLAETDRAILALVNRRLELVRRVKSRKTVLGIPFLDPERESWLVRSLQRANRGPLSSAGVGELQRALLALTKREVGRR